MRSTKIKTTFRRFFYKKAFFYIIFEAIGILTTLPGIFCVYTQRKEL